jgi:hypothetical protein
VGDEAEASSVGSQCEHAGRCDRGESLVRRAVHLREDDVRLDPVRFDADARLGKALAELARPPVVLREPVAQPLPRDEPCGGEQAGLVNRRAAEPAQVPARCGDRLLVAREQGAVRRAEALVEADGHGVGGGCEVGNRHVERGGGVRQAGAVQVHARAVAMRRVREGSRLVDAEHGAAGARVRVLEAEHGRPARHHRGLDLVGFETPEPDRQEAGDALDPSRFGDEDVGRRLDDGRATRRLEREQRHEVRDRAGGDEDRSGLAEILGDQPLEPPHRLVLSGARPAEARGLHRLPHLLGRGRAEIRAQVDHVRARCRPGRAPVCSPASITAVPLTSTSSMPSA